jgi:hypothetical protein
MLHRFFSVAVNFGSFGGGDCCGELGLIELHIEPPLLSNLNNIMQPTKIITRIILVGIAKIFLMGGAS